ncbi:hypothetical protein F4801DRAFT_577679 [Xylaria longipes]|nr:hypothetical protein F4801DRAFT_577679 [Xylaria longipes]
MLFQNERGGLELKDPVTQAFVKAKPQDGALIPNVGDMLQRAFSERSSQNTSPL